MKKLLTIITVLLLTLIIGSATAGVVLFTENEFVPEHKFIDGHGIFMSGISRELYENTYYFLFGKMNSEFVVYVDVKNTSIGEIAENLAVLVSPSYSCMNEIMKQNNDILSDAEWQNPWETLLPGTVIKYTPKYCGSW